jgi:hypothetical protein
MPQVVAPIGLIAPLALPSIVHSNSSEYASQVPDAFPVESSFPCASRLLGRDVKRQDAGLVGDRLTISHGQSNRGGGHGPRERIIEQGKRNRKQLNHTHRAHKRALPQDSVPDSQQVAIQTRAVTTDLSMVQKTGTDKAGRIVAQLFLIQAIVRSKIKTYGFRMERPQQLLAWRAERRRNIKRRESPVLAGDLRA